MTTFGNDAAAGAEPGARAAGAPRTRAPERAGESLRHDVLVVGAGPAGAATAIAARQHGLSVAVLERAACEPTWERTGDTRDIASPGESIAAAAQFALRELGLWQMFVAQGHRPSYLTQSAWGSNSLRERHAIEHKLGPDFHVDREHFDAWLRRQAAAAGAELFGSTVWSCFARARHRSSMRFDASNSRRRRWSTSEVRSRDAWWVAVRSSITSIGERGSRSATSRAGAGAVHPYGGDGA